jgi:hypothetical protein
MCFFSRQFIEDVIARMIQEDAAARSAFTGARDEQEQFVQAQPNHGQTLCVLGLIDAGLGRKEEAIREDRRAIELLPVGQNAPEGADMTKYLTMIAAWVDDKDLASEQLAIALSGPSGITYGELKVLPLWDPLRGDSVFRKNRRLTRAKRRGLYSQVKIDNFFGELKRRNVYKVAIAFDRREASALRKVIEKILF